MGDTSLVKPAGQAGEANDSILNMLDVWMARKYFIFNDDLIKTGDPYTFKIYIAAMENMMSYPAVSVGTALKRGKDASMFNVDTMTVKVSTDATNWSDATGNNGFWSATGLTLNNDNKIHVKLTINGTTKTINDNDYATFTI